jgi:hypothetical protein
VNTQAARTPPRAAVTRAVARGSLSSGDGGPVTDRLPQRAEHFRRRPALRVLGPARPEPILSPAGRGGRWPLPDWQENFGSSAVFPLFFVPGCELPLAVESLLPATKTHENRPNCGISGIGN